jgi:hypothetical protein
MDDLERLALCLRQGLVVRHLEDEAGDIAPEQSRDRSHPGPRSRHPGTRRRSCRRQRASDRHHFGDFDQVIDVRLACGTLPALLGVPTGGRVRGPKRIAGC